LFKDLIILEKQRTWKEAIGFYLAYSLLIFLVVVICAGLFGAIIGMFGGSFEASYRVGFFIGFSGSIISCLSLSFLILFKKRKLKSFGLILLALLSGIAGLLSVLGGMIPVAYLTTVKPEN